MIDLRLSWAQLRFLVKHRFVAGDFGVPRKMWVEYDPSWTREDIWRTIEARGFDFEDEIELRPIVDAKLKLGCGALNWNDDFLLAVGRMREGRPLSNAECLRLLRGSVKAVTRAAGKRYAELHGETSAHRQTYAVADLDELVERAPPALHSLPGTCLDPDRGILFEKPRPTDVGRVAAMPAGDLRTLATMVILIHPAHGDFTVRLPGALALIEKLAAAGLKGSPSDPVSVEAAMRLIAGPAPDGTDRLDDGPATGRVLSGEADDDRDQGAVWVGRYLELRDLVLAYVEWQRLEPGSGLERTVSDLLPAALPPDLSRRRRVERLRMDAAALRKRELTAAEVARRASDRLVGLHARLRQWERICAVADEAIAAAERQVEQGCPVTKPIGVSDTFKVIRPDGTIVPGLRQTVSFEIVTEDMLWLEAAKASGWDDSIQQYLSGEARGGSPYRRQAGHGDAPDGQYHRPGGDRRFHLRYVGTAPAGDEADEFHEPYLIRFYAVSALCSSMHMTSEQTRARSALAEENDLPLASKPMGGLTWWPQGPGIRLGHVVRRYTGRVILPYRQIRLLLGYGNAVARLELMSGTRLGETMQAHHGGCFKEMPLGDRMVATMRGRPKGWHRDRRWIVDKVTMGLLRRIKGWVIEQWHADVGVLPIVAYGEPKKNEVRLNCPPRRYLFQFGSRAADNGTLNACLQIATLGMPYARAHDYRYAFGKLLRLRRASRRQRARALSHGEDSAMVDRYGDWGCEGLSADDEPVAQLQDQLERELLEHLIDAA